LSRLSPQAISGVFVLLAGLAVVYALAAGPSTPEAKPQTASAPTVPTAVEIPPPRLEGIDLAVQRVLYASGKAQAIRVDELSELPPEVARVLATFGATLTIPESGASGSSVGLE
jgi:hypothetical protein